MPGTGPTKLVIFEESTHEEATSTTRVWCRAACRSNERRVSTLGNTQRTQLTILPRRGQGTIRNQQQGEEKWAVVGQSCIFSFAGKCTQDDRCIYKHITLSHADFEALTETRGHVVAAAKAGTGTQASDLSTGTGEEVP